MKNIDNLINNQAVKVPTDEEIGVDRPTAEELRETICKLKTQSDLHFVKAPDSLPGSVVHLSHCYDGRSVVLNITHLVITCLLGKSRKKSPELYSFQDYRRWKEEAKPTFCKRSLFSLLHANFCFTGKWLCLYKMLMKILIRTTLIQQPDLTWDDPLEEPTMAKMELAIQLYFILTREILVKPADFNSYLSIFYVYLFSDAGAQVMAHTVTILSVTNLQGKCVIKAQHLLLTSTAAHVAALSVPHLELLSLLRGVLALQDVLEALAVVGIQVAPMHRRAGVDSKVILTQIRSPANHFVKRTAHAVARIQLLLSELQMSPFTEVGHQNQAHSAVTFFPDLLTKVNWTSSLDHLVNTYKRVMDTEWMTHQHPLQLPGWDALVALPSLTDLDWMQLGGVLEGEIDVFRKTIMSHPVHTTDDQQHQTLIHSAATVLKEAAASERESEGDGLDSEILTEGFEPFYDTDEYEEVNEEEVNQPGPAAAEVEAPSGVPAKGKADVNRERKEEQGRQVTTQGEGNWDGAAFPNKPLANAASPPSGWHDQMAQLIERFHSKGLGHRGILPILSKVIQFVTRLRTTSQLGSHGRSDRQQSRLKQHQAWRRDQQAIKGRINTFEDEHFNWSENIDFSHSSLGDFDSLWLGPPTQIDPTSHQITVQAFQHLLGLFHSTKPVKGYSQKILQSHKLGPIHLLQGRRQRDFKKTGMYEVRLRSVQENTALERLLLWAVHRYSMGQSFHKAVNGLSFLNVYINQAERKLRKISAECTSCCRRRASLGKTSHKVKVDRKGPTENILLATRWLQGWTIVQSDLHGPIYVHFSPGAPAKKHYIICFLELPLKRLTSILVPSLSAADLLMALETYALQRGTECDIFYSDFGANYSRYHDVLSDLEPLDEAEESQKSVAWRNMLRAHYDKPSTSTSAIRFSQGRHEVLGPVEQAQYQIKRCLHAFNIHRRDEPLTFHQWTFLLSCVAQVVASRPLLIDNGKVYSPNTLLRLLGDVGRGEGHHGLSFHTQGAREVTRELKAKMQEIKQLRCDIAEVLLAHLVKKYFLDIQPRDQKLRSKGTESVRCGDIFFDPRIFKETVNVTASLLQLTQRGASHNHGLFKRTATHQGQRAGYVGRGFRELFFIASGTSTTQLGAHHWKAEALPTFQLSQVCPRAATQLLEFDTFAEVDTTDAAVGGDEGIGTGESVGTPESECRVDAGAICGGEAEEGGEGGEEGEAGRPDRQIETPAQARPVTTRFGRVIRTPKRFQV